MSNVISAATKFQQIAIFTWCEVSEAWWHTDTMRGDQFEAAYGFNGCDAPDSIQWRVI